MQTIKKENWRFSSKNATLPKLTSEYVKHNSGARSLEVPELKEPRNFLSCFLTPATHRSQHDLALGESQRNF